MGFFSGCYNFFLRQEGMRSFNAATRRRLLVHGMAKQPVVLQSRYIRFTQNTFPTSSPFYHHAYLLECLQ
jgi:hypothetical protein